MAYTPTPISFDVWGTPRTINSTDLITDLDDAVNDIIQDDPQALVPFINGQLSKLPAYLTYELEAMSSYFEDNTSRLSKAWATGTEPEGAGTYSSREWAEQSKEDADKAYKASVALTSVVGRNLLINGGFDIWQRGDTFNISSGYTADRWFILNSSAGTTIERVDADTDFSTNYALSISGDANGSDYLSIHAKVEDWKAIQGRFVTFSAKITKSPHKEIWVRFRQIDATGATLWESPEMPFGNTALGGTLKYHVTLSIPPLATFSPLGDSNFSVVIYPNRNMKGSPVVFGEAQLEISPHPTLFKQEQIADTLSQCERYYEITQAFPLDYNSGVKNMIDLPFRAVKRKIPTITTEANITWTTNYTNTYRCSLYNPTDTPNLIYADAEIY